MKSYAWMAGMLLFALPLGAQEREVKGTVREHGGPVTHPA